MSRGSFIFFLLIFIPAEICFCFCFHRSSSCAGGLALPGGAAAAASEFGPGQRGPGEGDQQALEETPGLP